MGIFCFSKKNFKETKMSKIFCLFCSKFSEDGAFVHDITVEDDDGLTLTPLTLILQYFEEDINIPKSSQCCESCSLKLKKFAILEKKYQNLKDDLLNSLKSQKTLYKRKRNKIYINQDEVGEDEEISQMEIHQLT